MVVSTLVTARTLSLMGMSKGWFTHIFIDEAAQVLCVWVCVCVGVCVWVCVCGWVSVCEYVSVGVCVCGCVIITSCTVLLV